MIRIKRSLRKPACANFCTSIATLRLATSAIAKAHQWAGHESPCRDRGVREALKGWGRRLAKPRRQAGALTANTLAVIRLTALKPHARGRGFETAEQAAERARFDLALVEVLSDGGLRRSEAAALTWGDMQRCDDGSGRITVIRSKTDVEVQGGQTAMLGLAAMIRCAGMGDLCAPMGLPFQSGPQCAGQPRPSHLKTSGNSFQYSANGGSSGI